MTTHPDGSPLTYPPLLVQGQTWEEMTVGSVFRTAARTITESDLITFVTWSGFNEALFLDASHAAAGGYTGRLVPGALVYCLGEGLVIQTNVINGTGLAFMSMDLSIKRPAYVGDTIHVVVEVTEARAASTGQRGVVTTRTVSATSVIEDVLITPPSGSSAAAATRPRSKPPNGLDEHPLCRTVPGHRRHRLQRPASALATLLTRTCRAKPRQHLLRLPTSQIII